MSLSNEQKANIIKEFGKSDTDTGSASRGFPEQLECPSGTGMVFRQHAEIKIGPIGDIING